MAVTYPTIIYGQDSTVDRIPRLIRSTLGDGNQFVIKDGINHMLAKGQIVHPLLDVPESTTIRTFLRTYCDGSVVQIKDYMEDYSGNTTMNVILTGYRETFDGVVTTFTVDYEEVPRTT